MLLALGRELTLGRLAAAPVRFCVPAVGRVLLLGLAVALDEPVLPETELLMLPVVGREAVVVPLIEPPVRPLPMLAPLRPPLGML